MKVEFRRLTIVDFFSFGHAVLQLDDLAGGLYLVKGENRDDAGRSNGGGKSALVSEALSWCLFGKTLRRLEGADDVVRKGTSVATVTASFMASDKLYEVSRDRARNGKSRLLLSVASDGSWDIGAGSIADTQAKLEEILGMTWDVFCSAVVFGQSSSWKFSSLSDRERKQVVDKALGAEVYREAAKVASADAQEVRRAAEKVEARIDLEKALRDEAKYQVEDAIARASKLGDGESAQIKELRKEVGRDPAASRANLVENVRAKRARLADFEEKAAFCRRNLDRAKDAASTAKAALERRICPACGQALSEEVRGRFRAALTEASSEARALFVELDGLKKPTGSTRASLDRDEEALRKRDLAAARLDAAERSLKEARSGADGSSIEQARAKLEAIEGKIAELLKKGALLNEEAATLDYVAKVLGDRGMATAVVEHAVPALNEEAARASRELAGGLVDVQFSTTSETKGGKALDSLVLEVENSAGADSYRGSSTGERAIVDLCASSAIQALVAGKVQVNLAVYDEALDSLDQVAGARVLRFLKEHAAESGKAIFVVSHAGWVEEAVHFDGVLIATKEDGTSSARLER